MYRRYQPYNTGNPTREKTTHSAKSNNVTHRKTEEKTIIPEKKNPPKQTNFLTKLLPQSLYNPETGKVLGIISAEDLFLLALIILLIDNDDEDEDSSMLIYALIYILISEHMELPF